MQRVWGVETPNKDTFSIHFTLLLQSLRLSDVTRFKDIFHTCNLTIQLLADVIFE